MSQTESSVKRSRASKPGAAAARAMVALNEHKKAEAARREKYKAELFELERLAAAERSRLRKHQRDERQSSEARVASRLGRDMLVQMRKQGTVGTTVADLVAAWSPMDMAELLSLIEPDSAADHEAVELPSASEPSLTADTETRLDG